MHFFKIHFFLWLQIFNVFLFILVLTNACDLDLFSLQDIGTSYARLFALSRSEPHEICELVSLMLIGGASLDTINELLLLASRQKPQTGRVGKTVQQTLKVVLESFRLVFQIIIIVWEQGQSWEREQGVCTCLLGMTYSFLI